MQSIKIQFMLGIYQINRAELTPDCPRRFASTSVSSINELKNKAAGAKRWGAGRVGLI